MTKISCLYFILCCFFFCSRHLFIHIGAIISQQGKTRLNKISVCSKWTSFVIKCVISFVVTHSTPTLAGRFIDVDFVHVFVLIPPVMELLIQFLIEFVDVLLTIFNHSTSLRRSFFITLFLSEFSLIIIKVHLINHSWNNCSPFRWKCSLKKSVLCAKCYTNTHTHTRQSYTSRLQAILSNEIYFDEDEARRIRRNHKFYALGTCLEQKQMKREKCERFIYLF